MNTQPIIHTFVTRTGLTINVRHLAFDDAPHLVDLFENMSAESRYNRFLQSAENVSIDRVWSVAETFASQSTAGGFGLVAMTDLPERDNVAVGAARYVSVDDERAEIAVSIRDDMQHMGIGKRLMQLLLDQAAERGIKYLVGTVQNSNVGMWTLLKKLGHRVERIPEGSTSYISIYVDEKSDPSEEWSPVAILSSESQRER